MTAGPSTDLRAAAGALWPGADVVDGHAGGHGEPVRARFVVVPHGRDPRMLVPEQPAARGASVLRFNAASRWRDSATRLLASTVLRRAPGLVAHDTVEVRGGDGHGIDAALAELLGSEVRFSIGLGTARVNRKPVLQVFDPDGRVLAFAKLGTTDETAAAVRAEAEALLALQHHHFEVLLPPRLIGLLDWNGSPVLVMEALDVPAWQRSGGRPRVPVSAMAELGAAFAEADQPLEDSAWWRRQWAAVAGLEDRVLGARIGRCLDRLALVAADRPLAWSAWHGDWTPWNMARARGRTLVWDWERFETGVPRGLDHTHFLVNLTTSRHGEDPDAILLGLDLAHRAGLWPEAPAHVQSLLYLVAITTRYSRLLRTSAAHHIAPRAAAALVALEQLSGEATGIP